jgi:hypothetical protein
MSLPETSFKTITVGIAPDAIEQIAKVPPDRAVEELIWNAIDAEATKIEVIFYENKLQGIDRIVVSDNGHGIPVEAAESIFGDIGGSPKRLRRRSPTLGRPYHGKEGKGRYKGFSIGNRVEWHSRCQVDGNLQAFSVRLTSASPRCAEIGAPTPCDGHKGCDVIITDLRDGVSSLQNVARLEALTYRLAPYLMAHPDIQITYAGEVLDVKSQLKREATIPVQLPNGDGESVPVLQLRVLEWLKQRKPLLFLCDEHGVALDEMPPGVREGQLPFSAYLLSARIRQLYDEGRLALSELDEEVAGLRKAARETLQDYFRQRHAEEAATIAERIQREGIYPYTRLPTSPVEKAERQMFDICAATIHEYLPSFERGDKSARQFTYRLLREALESNPTNLTTIFKEVLKLSEEQQQDLVGILGKTSLGAIIHTAKTVCDRLAFLNGLEQILHDKTIRKYLKERTQLQRILVEELWVFGDAYTLGADDASLKTVLAEHRAAVGLCPLDAKIVADEIADLTGIPDLVLWRQYLRGRNDRYENLVVELKRPTVAISLDEISQVKRYASKVVNNRYFDKSKTHWTFVALSDDIAADAEGEVNQQDRESGHVTRGKDYDIWVRRWSEIIHEAKTRMNWVQDRLNYAVDDNSEGMAYLRRKFGHLLPATALKSEEESESALADHDDGP